MNHTQGCAGISPASSLTGHWTLPFSIISAIEGTVDFLPDFVPISGSPDCPERPLIAYLARFYCSPEEIKKPYKM